MITKRCIDYADLEKMYMAKENVVNCSHFDMKCKFFYYKRKYDCMIENKIFLALHMSVYFV
jgi:hypothetical protein